MENCIFCKISKKEIEAYIINESENFLSFLDIHPHAPGHTLVIPKMHFENLKKFDSNFSKELIEIIKNTMLKISKALNTEDFTLGINEGSLAGQAILHLHFHIIPRFKNDKGGSIHSVVFNKPKKSLEDIYLAIKNF
jgi:histidine triad (HIT) family protein